MIDKKLLEANLIKLLELELLPLDKKVKILQQTAELVQKRLMVRLLNQLNDTEQKEFLDLLDAEGREAEKEEFLARHFPNLEELMDEEIVKVKGDLKESAAT